MSENHNPPQVLDTACIFLCPIKMEAEGPASIAALEGAWQTKGSQHDVSDSIHLFAFPEHSQSIRFSKHNIACSILPRIGCSPICHWGVLILEVQPKEFPMSFVDLLNFNVGFRRTQGDHEMQDSFFGTDLGDLKLSDGSAPSLVYERMAEKILGQGGYHPLPRLTKALLLCYAKVDRSLSDEELYRLGSVAYPNEPTSPEWVSRMQENVFDRWKPSGLRGFIYSYSLVYALANTFQGRDDQAIRAGFLNEYLKMGVALAIQRAWLQEFPDKVRQASNIDDLRDAHREMVAMQSHFGFLWTSEGTQRMRIEQMWRKTTGVDERMNDVKTLLEQKIGLEEAQETAILNKKTADLNIKIFILQLIFGIIYGSQIGVALRPDLMGIVQGGLIGGVFTLVAIVLFDRMKNLIKKFFKASIFRNS